LERNLCFMLDCLHVMKVICRYQLDVAVTLADVSIFKYSPTYINTNRQTYTKHFLRPVFKYPLINALSILHSSLHLPSYVSLLLSFHPYFLPSFLLSSIPFYFLNSFLLSFLPLSLLFSFIFPFFFPSF
jgi:hypothetical protein